MTPAKVTHLTKRKQKPVQNIRTQGTPRLEGRAQSL